MEFLNLGILVVLILVFAYLTFRAWGSKRPILKWVGLVLGGLLTIIFVLAFVAAFKGVMTFNANYNASNPVVEVKVAGTPEQIKRGEAIAHICSGCHGENGTLPLKGQNFAGPGGPPVGTLYAANLTPAGELKDWSDGEIIRAIREGVHKSGRSLIIMPSVAFHQMSDEDVQAVVAYLRSQPATEPATPPTQFNLVGDLLAGTVFGGAFSVQPHITQPIVAPPQGPTKEYGAYLMGWVGCKDCHGENLTGGIDQGSGAAAPNLTLIVPQWTQEQFHTFFRTGKLPSGQTVSDNMPWKDYNQFATDDELTALYEYLHALPPTQAPAK